MVLQGLESLLSLVVELLQVGGPGAGEEDVVWASLARRVLHTQPLLRLALGSACGHRGVSRPGGPLPNAPPPTGCGPNELDDDSRLQGDVILLMAGLGTGNAMGGITSRAVDGLEPGWLRGTAQVSSSTFFSSKGGSKGGGGCGQLSREGAARERVVPGQQNGGDFAFGGLHHPRAVQSIPTAGAQPVPR